MQPANPSSPSLDLAAYLRRVEYEGALEPTEDVLRALHLAHATHIPFENLDILLGLPIQIKFRSDRIGNFRVYMMGGVKFEYDLASKAAARNAEDLIKLKSSDFGIEAAKKIL